MGLNYCLNLWTIELRDTIPSAGMQNQPGKHSCGAESLFETAQLKRNDIFRPLRSALCAAYLLKVVERGENNFMASPHETNCRQELQDERFCSGKTGNKGSNV